MLNGRQGRNIICLIIPTYVFPGLKTHICKFKIRTERKKENQKRGKNKTREIKKLKVHNIKAISSVQLSLSVVSDSATSWTATHQASLLIVNSWNLPKPTSIKLVMSSNHLILCRPLLLLPSIIPSIRVFSNE